LNSDRATLETHRIKDWSIDKVFKEMLIGVLLGDSHINRTGLDKAFVSFEQSKNKIEYLNYLHKLVKEGNIPLIGDSIKSYSRYDSRYNIKNNSLYFRTQSLDILKPFADLFLNSKGKKIVPDNIAEHLTIRGLAF
jgi:oligoribonuclease (3'-5' exoribonuclease)